MRTASHPANAGSRKRRPCLGLNPSTGPVYLVYDVPEGVTQVQVLVHDATGRLAFGEVVGTKGRVLELPQHALASGLHVATLLFDGIQVGATKVEVVR